MTTEDIVSNTSPIINLARIGYLHLLPALYGTVVIPTAVFREITQPGDSRPGAREVMHAAWIQVHAVRNPDRVKSLRHILDPGEAETITLCEELNRELLLLDERKARRIAAELGLRPLGLLAVIIESKHKGIIDRVQPLLDALINEAGFRVSSQLYERVLTRAGESHK